MVYNHQPRKVGKAVQQRINALGIGQKMQDLPEDLWHDSFRYYVKEDPNRQGGPNLRMIRLDPDQPSLTVTGYIFNKFVHPFEDRFITPREAARLQGFPDDYEFLGTPTRVQRQVGDAVPVELAQAIFQAVLHTLKLIDPTRTSFRALSLFSGAGGFELGAAQAVLSDGSRVQPIVCVENEADCCETLYRNFRNEMLILQQDITTLDPAELLKDGMRLDIVYGGPPCQSFSQAGKQRGTHDPRGKLLFEFLRFVEVICPPFFILENVANLRAIDGGRLLDNLLAKIDQLGYLVDCRILNAAHYGSPQKRRRLIFLGSLKTLPHRALLPEPTHAEAPNLLGLQPFKTVRDAFDGLPSTITPHHL